MDGMGQSLHEWQVADGAMELELQLSTTLAALTEKKAWKKLGRNEGRQIIYKT